MYEHEDSKDEPEMTDDDAMQAGPGGWIAD